MKNMLQTPVRLECTGSDEAGFATLAGKSEGEDSVRVLISNFGTDYKEFLLTVKALPWDGKTSTVQLYVIDDTHNMTLVEKFEESLRESLVMRHEMAPSSVYLISLETSETVTETAISTQTSHTQSLPVALDQSFLLAGLVLTVVAITIYAFRKRARSGK